MTGLLPALMFSLAMEIAGLQRLIAAIARPLVLPAALAISNRLRRIVFVASRESRSCFALAHKRRTSATAWLLAAIALLVLLPLA